MIASTSLHIVVLQYPAAAHEHCEPSVPSFVFPADEEAAYVNMLREQGARSTADPATYGHAVFLWGDVNTQDHPDWRDQYIDRAIQIKDALFGKASPSHAIEYCLRAKVRQSQGHESEVEPLLKKALMLRERAHIPKDSVLKEIYMLYREYLLEKGAQLRAEVYRRKSQKLPDYEQD